MIPWLDASIATKHHNNTQYMHIYIYICLSRKMYFWTFKKIEVKNLSVLEEIQGQFWNQHWISHKVKKRYFPFSSYFSDEARKAEKNCFQKYRKIKIYKKYAKRMKIENVSSLLYLEFNADSKTVLVFSIIDSFWLLFFWNLYKKKKIPEKQENRNFLEQYFEN